MNLLLDYAGFIAFLSTVLTLLSRVFLGLAVFYDAKALRKDHSTMWGWLCGLFFLIPLIVYLILRSDAKGTVPCPRCGNKIAAGLRECPICRAPLTDAYSEYYARDTAEFKRKTKTNLILFIACYALSIIISVFISVVGVLSF